MFTALRADSMKVHGNFPYIFVVRQIACAKPALVWVQTDVEIVNLLMDMNSFCEIPLAANIESS